MSRLVGEMLERQMRLSDHYWRAFDHWKSSRPLAGAGAAGRLSREEAHERREAGARVTEYSGSNPGLGLESGESGSIYKEID